jgi:putative inorganic carbon (hco3(-)) transporter
VLRSLWLLALYLGFVGLGFSVPFVATLGYVWVDTFRPQEVAYILLNQLPVALIMGVVALGSYILFDRRSPPRMSLETGLQAAMAIWVTLTLFWAEVPEAAWDKWDWAFKTLVFATFVPFVIRSRVQMEAFSQVYVLALAANFIPFGVKTMISGGGYGMNVGLRQGNSGLAEGGLLSTVCLMAVPLAIHLSQHGQLNPQFKLIRLGYWGIAALAVVTAIGTYERSALIGLTVLGSYMWIRSRHKFGFGIVAIAASLLVVYATSDAWVNRISTIGTYQSESSAFVRILVWKWTLGYTATHPMGGGFGSYLISHIELPGTPDSPGQTVFGRAFHSIYFEVLGEQGYLGLVMFLTVAATTILKLHRVSRKARAHPDLAWLAGLSDAVQSGLAVFMTSGAFVGIAFQPMFWYFIAMGVSINAYMWRVETARPEPAGSWRPPIDAGTRDPNVLADWRGRHARTELHGRFPRR